MCSVEDQGQKTDLPIPRSGKSLVGSGCVKCGEPGVLITRIHDSFCKNCFQVYVVHKFRSAIGKSKLIRDGEKVLVAFSGGANSSALLHLIQDGLSLRAHKRLRFTPTLLHVDETGVFGNRTDEVKEKREQIRKIMCNSRFPSYWTQLEKSLDDCRVETKLSSKSNFAESTKALNIVPVSYLGQGTETNALPEDPALEASRKLQDLVKSFKSSSAQEDFVHNLRNQLLVVVARQLGFSKILTAESSTRLAVRILTDIAQGRGSQVSLDTGISDERNSDVMFMRPVRELNAKELAMYNSLFGVKSIFMQTLTTKTAMASSIERLTETFVTGLQADYPSTVSNIVRTSGKLGSPDFKGTDKCSFCQSPLDTNVGKTSALGAVLFSQQMSRHNSTDSKNFLQNSADSKNTQLVNGSNTSLVSLINLQETLCYGCRLSLHAYGGDVSSLPHLITERAMPSIRERQRDHLSGFLLEEDTEASADN